MTRLEIKELSVEADGKIILKNVNFAVQKGQLIVIMGPNGSGKTTLAYSIMGHPKYKIVKGKILLNGEDITSLSPEERNKKGIFLMFQNPIEVRGLKVITYLNAIINKRDGIEDITLIRNDVIERLRKLVREVGLSEEHLYRDLNVGFSGGEKKRLELLQVLLSDSNFVIMDEPDSGLDVSGVRMLADSIKGLLDRGIGIILITHYTRLINLLEPTEVLVLKNGTIVARGHKELAKLIEEKGYEAV